MERKEQKKQKKYPLLKVLLMFFITLPFITLVLYTYAKDNDRSSTSVVTEDSGVAGPVYVEPEEEEEQTSEEEENDDKATSEKMAEPAPEATAAIIIDETQKQRSEKHMEKQIETNAKPPEEEKKPEIEIPKKETPLEKKEETKNEAIPNDDKQPEGKIVYHTVKPQETVFRISMTYYKSQAGIEKIRKANNLNGNEIRVGQVLKIPLP
ncbi:LysM peptidoglycan-binding domain-containing protein [Bacillus aerolatus]|uniref:LysM peptidoglycan-binding domain-containing protein n=2 Tax=Bacillus aerolatus TaxID=2653354 RepID=A0A6I1FPG7_9BACI|nr:LysM peptidoglycan-binding domain-containing protein [Bacillus aerolatus]